RRDLSALARVSFFALLGLIIFGIVMIFVRIPNGDLIYSVIGLVIFAGFTMIDFQRLRTSKDIRSAPLLAASIFLDILNVFLFFLPIFSGNDCLQVAAGALAGRINRRVGSNGCANCQWVRVALSITNSFDCIPIGAAHDAPAR